MAILRFAPLPALVAAVILGTACSSTAEDGPAFATTKAPTDTVTVRLTSYVVAPDKPSVAAGPVKFVATNASPEHVHELAVLRIKDDRTLQNGGEIEDLKPNTAGEIVLDLPKGKYELACLLAAGEEGSTVDHYKEGMKVAFEVR